jgi:ParB family chromosome partitioning protein
MTTRYVRRPPTLRLDLIDAPQRPARESWNDQLLIELSESIRDVGLIQPIVVRPVGDRFEIVAGHRRYMAAQMAGLSELPAVVRDVNDVQMIRLRVHENQHREDWNPAHEANWYAELIETHCDRDVDKLCDLVQRKRAYVEARLLLVLGDPAVFVAVRDEKIPFSVASELNKIQSASGRAMYLDAAIKGGASARIVREWRSRAEYFDTLNPDAAPAAGERPEPPEQMYGSSLVCIICGTNSDHHELQLVYIHRSCQHAILDRFLATLPQTRPVVPTEKGA